MVKLILMGFIILLFGCASSIKSINCPANLYCLDLQDNWLKSDKGYPRARAFANKTAIYAVYSANVYDKSASIYPEIFLPANEFHDPIFHDEGIDTITNFRGKAWLRYRYGVGQKQDPILVIAFRGTDSWGDTFSGNLKLIETDSLDQFKSAKNYTNKVMSSLKARGVNYSKIVFTGHSLGGGLAEYMQLITDKSEAIVFMTSPNNGYIYSLFSGDDRKNMNTIRVYEKGEILNAFRLISTPDIKYDNWPNSNDDIKTAWLDFFTWSLIDDHSIRDFTMQLLQAAAIEGNCSAHNVIMQINNNYGTKIQSHISPKQSLDCKNGNNEVENQTYPIKSHSN
ncbi:Mbeg1-like protein [Pseudocolwellia sp. AS88]|uniref:lipase family protein n=1 Tax=Pseudocolwellia sp. AS88 TaxID=3063958 RepID=UPI0026EC4260|nr:Mbeg1-like protein [Pseudocolwellia sp. AS88]MDO7086273.1 DUF2974 domain-containing protein [Pseudocolwellia sp. AS88]